MRFITQVVTLEVAKNREYGGGRASGARRGSHLLLLLIL